MWWMRPMLSGGLRPVPARRRLRALAIQRARAEVRLRRTRADLFYDMLDELLDDVERVGRPGPAAWQQAAAPQPAAWPAAPQPARPRLGQRLMELRQQRAAQVLDSLAQLWGVTPGAAAPMRPGQAALPAAGAAMADFDL